MNPLAQAFSYLRNTAESPSAKSEDKVWAFMGLLLVICAAILVMTVQLGTYPLWRPAVWLWQKRNS